MKLSILLFLLFYWCLRRNNTINNIEYKLYIKYSVMRLSSWTGDCNFHHLEEKGKLKNQIKLINILFYSFLIYFLHYLMFQLVLSFYHKDFHSFHFNYMINFNIHLFIIFQLYYLLYCLKMLMYFSFLSFSKVNQFIHWYFQYRPNFIFQVF